MVKPYNLHGIAGLAERTKHPETGCTMSLYVAEQAGIDSEDPWMVVCETHGSMVSARSRVQGYESMENPEWCEECVALEMKPNARKDPFVKRMENAASWLPPSAWYGRKVFLAPLAHEMNIPMGEFERTVIRMHQAGTIELSRADMVQAMDPRLVQQSEVHPTGMSDVTYHFWNATSGAKPMTPNARKQLWKYNQVTGLWDQQRSVTDETAEQWLRVYRKDEPREHFTVSSRRPSGKAFSFERKLTPNHSAVYYVWIIDYRNVPIDEEGPYGPMSLDRAASFARIGATNGDHDRAVSVGRNPEAESFEIVRRYRRGTGERML